LLGDDVIETVADAYRLRADADQLDLLRFDRLLSQAASAATDDHAAAALAEAIGLWRGDPLANITSPALTSEIAPQLTERYLVACEQWAEISLRLGHTAEVARRFAPLAGAHPFRETIVRLLMLALYRDGRQADALKVYDNLRNRLSAELGADPGPALQDLHTAILRGAPADNGRGQPAPATVAVTRLPITAPRYSGTPHSVTPLNPTRETPNEARPMLECEVERAGAEAVRSGLDLILDRLHPASQFADRTGAKPGTALEWAMGSVRGRILQALEQPLTMRELAKISGEPPYAISSHCKRLVAAGLVQQEHLGDEAWVSRTSRGAKMVALFTEVA
jgi:hypothetical protein